MYESIMHVALNTPQIEKMIDFYVNKLGMELKVLTRFKSYLNRPDRPYMYEVAKKDPEKIFSAYIEAAPRQFLELFPQAMGENKDLPEEGEFLTTKIGLSHFALTVKDIYETRKILEEKGVEFDTAISKGPSGTYQMWTHDPDGNKFEIMQFTEDSVQLKGQID